MSIPCSTLPPVYLRVVLVTKPSTSSTLAVISSPLPAAESISRPTPDTLSKSANNSEGRHDALPSVLRIGIVDGEQISDGSSSDVVEVIGEDNNDAGESSGDSSSSDVVEVKVPSRHSTRSNFASWKGKAVKAAMEEEMRSLLANGTWELVPRPRSVKVMKNQWVLTTKYNTDDTVARKKARLVVKGFTEIYGADYDETYSPVDSYVTLHFFLSIVAVLDLHVLHLDVKNAYLQSKLDRVLHMEQPAYFNDGTSRVCKLLKSLYGLKRSPLLWYSALDSVLIGGGWSKSQVDEALYFKFGADGVGCWLLVYVDNLLAASSSLEMLKDLRELLQNAFELREITPVQKYLGLEIVRDRSARKLWLHQSAYVDKMRHRFVDEEQTGRCPKTPISVDVYTELTFDDEEYQAREEEEYVTTTRPDIVYACTTLRYADSDDVGDRQTRSSTSGYVFVLGGGAASWASHRIKCMTLSSTEFEYIPATEADKEARRLRFLLAGVPTVIHVDNSFAIAVVEGLGLKGSLKDMERRYIRLQQMVKFQKLALTYIPKSEQPTDYLTKALHYLAFKRCSVTVGQVDLADDEHDNE
ncbi:unnamed protein product [Closterium sp. NIES-54]